MVRNLDICVLIFKYLIIHLNNIEYLNKSFRLHYVDTSYLKITASHVWTISKYYACQNSIEIYLFTSCIASYYAIRETNV